MPFPTQPNNTEVNTCQSLIKLNRPKEEVVALFEETEEQFSLFNDQYQARIDNGNTAALLAQVSATQSNNPVLKASLMEVSPYLSVTVLKTIINDMAFTDQDLFDILNANPEALYQGNILNESNLQALLSANLYSQLEAGASSISERGELEMVVTYYKAEKDKHARDIIDIMHNLEDEEKTAEDVLEIQSWMQTFETLPTNYSIVDYLFNSGNQVESMNLFASIPSTFSLDNDQNLSYQSLDELYGILNQLVNEDRNEVLLTEEEYDLVDGLAEFGHGKGQVKARNIMRFFYGKEYPLDLQFLEAQEAEEKSEGLINKPQGEVLSKVSLELLPNPANDVLNISYLSPSIYGNAGEIVIVDNTGHELFRGEIDEQEKKFNLQVSAWKSGVYYCIYRPTASKQKVIPFVISH